MRAIAGMARSYREPRHSTQTAGRIKRNALSAARTSAEPTLA